MKILPVALLAALALAPACGGGVDAHDYDGTWLISSLTLAGESGPVTLTRDGAPVSIRGDAVFAATSDTAATMKVRQLVLDEGLPANDVETPAVSVAVEEGRWILTESGEVSVFTTELEGEHLMLMLDPEDTRNTAADPPLEIMVDRVAPWSTACVGSWDLVSMTTSAGTITGNACTRAGDRWFKPQMMISFDSRLLFQRILIITSYADAACTDLVDMQSTMQLGYAEEESGAALRMWGVEPATATAEYLAFSTAVAGDTMTLTRTACLPMPSCTTSAPTTVVVTRR